MTLPIFQAMQVVELGKVPAICDLTKVTWTAEPPRLHAALSGEVEYQVRVEIGYRRIASKDAAAHVINEATDVISEQVYGPILAELTKIRRDLWFKGQSCASEAERIQRLIDLMAGE